MQAIKKNFLLIITSILIPVGLIEAQQVQSEQVKTAQDLAASVQNAHWNEMNGRRLVQFGGTLKDAQGQILTGVQGVTFSIYKDSQGGAALWQENQNVQFDAQGRYSTLLGAASGQGIPVDVFSSDEPRWLAVTLADGTETGRLLLVSVPYALKAADADTLGGKPLSAFVLNESASGSTDSATPTPSSLDDKAKVTLKPRATLNGTALFLAKYVSPTDIAQSQIIEDGASGNVGIGTSTPFYPLNVKRSTYTSSTAGSNILLRLESNASNADANIQFSDGVSNSAQFGMQGGAFYITSNGAESFRVAASGNIGIGTTSPAKKLDVQGGQVNASGGLCIAGVCQTSASAFSSASIRGIVYLGGCDTCSVLQDTDDQRTIYFNAVGPMTIQEVRCFSDTGTPTINIQRDNGSLADILSSPLQCSTSGALAPNVSVSLTGANVLNLNDKLDFVMVAAGGAAHRVTVSIKAIVN
jgi:hypothetical protein